jgi:N-acetyl sugar amidotransferase
MDTSDPAIVFDAQGVCDHCLTFERKTLPNWIKGKAAETKLQALSRTIREDGRGRDYDCMIGISGGVDSSYLSYLAKERMGLRPLLFHVDAGWNSQTAVNNIERMVDGLGVDLHTEVINWKEMRDLQLAFFKSGVPHIDAPQDHAFFGSMYKFAEKHKIKHILIGANLSTECIRNPVDWMYYQSDSVQLLDIHKRFGTVPLATFPVMSILHHKVYLPYIAGIRVDRPLNLVPFVKQEAVEFLAKTFGWQPYPQKHFESRFTRFYESYWLPKKFGYDVRRVQYSSLILTGQMAREDAVLELTKQPYHPDEIAHDIEFVAKKMGISAQEIDSFMKAPNRSFRDFRNQYWLYRLGSGVMKTFGLEVGGKR